MKKYLVLLLLSFILVSCNKTETQPVTTEIQTNTQQEVIESTNNVVVENISNSGSEEESRENIQLNESEIQKSSDKIKFNYIASTGMNIPFEVKEYDNNFIYGTRGESIEKKGQGELKQIIHLIEDNFFEDFKKNFGQDFLNKEKLLFKNGKYYGGVSMYYDNNYIYFLPPDESCDKYISIPVNIKIDGNLLYGKNEELYYDNNNSYKIDYKSCLLKIIK